MAGNVTEHEHPFGLIVLGENSSAIPRGSPWQSRSLVKLASSWLAVVGLVTPLAAVMIRQAYAEYFVWFGLSPEDVGIDHVRMGLQAGAFAVILVVLGTCVAVAAYGIGALTRLSSTWARRRVWRRASPPGRTTRALVTYPLLELCCTTLIGTIGAIGVWHTLRALGWNELAAGLIVPVLQIALGVACAGAAIRDLPVAHARSRRFFHTAFVPGCVLAAGIALFVLWTSASHAGRDVVRGGYSQAEAVDLLQVAPRAISPDNVGLGSGAQDQDAACARLIARHDGQLHVLAIAGENGLQGADPGEIVAIAVPEREAAVIVRASPDRSDLDCWRTE